MKNKALLILVHIVAWGGFLAIPLLFLSKSPMHGPMADAPMRGVIVFWLSSLMLIGFYYLNYFVLLPRLFLKKEYLIYFSIVIGCFILYLFLPGMLFHPEPPAHPPHPAHMEGGVNFHRLGRGGNKFFMFLLVFFISIGIKFSNIWRQAEEDKVKIQGEKLKAELSYLKAQINPHFLFNTLNSIYSLAIKRSENTADAVLKLSEMMRYVITDVHKDLVPLEKELTYIRNYIELQKMRLTSHVKLDILIEDDHHPHELSPLLLIAFIENAFKYGNSTQHESFVSIHIRVKDDILYMDVKNRIWNRTNEATDETGIGVTNTRKRLEIQYPGKHLLKMTEQDEVYSVNLQINLI